jgi:hypothetical protein
MSSFLQFGSYSTRLCAGAAVIARRRNVNAGATRPADAWLDRLKAGNVTAQIFWLKTRALPMIITAAQGEVLGPDDLSARLQPASRQTGGGDIAVQPRAKYRRHPRGTAHRPPASRRDRRARRAWWKASDYGDLTNRATPQIRRV